MVKQACVVFLDDEDKILSSLERLFYREPFRVLTTTDYHTALEWLDKEEVKVVISDQRMPEITGTQFLHQVSECSPATVRILFTGYADLTAAEDAINLAGVYRFITKPWENSELIDAVHQAVARYDADKSKSDRLQKLQSEVEELEHTVNDMRESEGDYPLL